MVTHVNRETDERRAIILTALREAGQEGVSGETLACELGISRVAVSKHISALRGLGYEITAVPGRGYALCQSPNLPLVFEVYPWLETTDVDLYGGQITGSTNDDAWELAREGAREGTVVLASGQTKGRGRLGRTWESPAGGLYLSAVLRPRTTPERVVALPLIAGLGILSVCKRLGVEHAGIKWPNDVLIDGRKLNGILTEITAQMECVDIVVCGIGINVNRPPDSQEEWAYLSDGSTERSLAQIAALVIDEVYARFMRWREEGFVFAPFEDEYNANLCILGRHVSVRDMGGHIVAEGEVGGVDALGRLRVGDTLVVAGEVTLRD